MSDREERIEKYLETKEEAPQAHREIYEMLLKGYTPEEITPIINKNYSCDRKTTRRWMKHVLRRIGEAQSDNNKEYGLNLGLAVERFLHVYQKAVEDGKHNIALQCLKTINELQGLTGKGESKQVAQSSSTEDSDVSSLSDEELKKILMGEETDEKD